MSDESITITIPVSDVFCADILCTAFEGGVYAIGYWACCDDVQYGSSDPLNECYYKSLTIVPADADDEEWKHVVDYAAIRRGLQCVMTPGFKVNPTLRAYIQRALAEGDTGHIDAEAADVIVQAACFGEIVYG